MVPLAILLPRNFIIVAQTHIGQSWLLPSIPTHFSMTHDNVAGHLALRGDNTWEPLLQDSSPLFAAITADAPGRVTELLRARPEQVNSLLTLLYWGGDPNAAGAAARAQVSVKRRTPLMLAAQFGSTAVMEALLKQGATASTRVPEDDCTALQVGVGWLHGSCQASRASSSKASTETGRALLLCPSSAALSLVTL